ncbi:MAG: hypothetical protein V4487_04140 [Chlamydiota bacterium]
MIRMPLRDKKRLQFFFREVCFLSVWPYTLMGSKPVSIHQYTKPWYAIRRTLEDPDLKDILHQCFWPPHFKKICYFFRPVEMKTKWGVETLQKYLSYFPNSRFFLDIYPHDETVGFALVDKVQLAKIVTQHREDFRFVLESLGIEPEDLCRNEKIPSFLKRIGSNGLLGTVLGFGRDNAWLYDKYIETDVGESLMMTAWPEEQILNLDQLNQRTLSFQPWELADLFYPRFACDPQSEETRRLKQIYREERAKIVAYYEGKDLVEATLSLFNH